MKIRIKFRKHGVMKFIGHLDMMRYFQKAMRRADIPIKFTEGFSPHMVMSFANPLGVGLTSDAEYFDIELKEPVASLDAVERLNKVMVDGVDIVSFVEIEDGRRHTGMAIVSAADYKVSEITNGFTDQFKERFDSFVALDEVKIVKKTKKSEREVDIRPLIYGIKFDGEAVTMQVATGSVENLKPDLVMSSMLEFMDIDSSTMKFTYHRTEVYADSTVNDDRFIPLDGLGNEVVL